jgi:hypothetical protein
LGIAALEDKIVQQAVVAILRQDSSGTRLTKQHRQPAESNRA